MKMIKTVKRFALRSVLGLSLALSAAAVSTSTYAAGEAHVEPELQKWTYAGVFGRFDKNQLQRGFQVYYEVCSACHSMDLIAFRNLGEKGGPEFSEGQVKELAAEYIVLDIEAEDGERDGIPADRFPNPFANVIEAAEANGGVAPPDLSLIAKGRSMHRGFPTWIIDFFTTYSESGSDYIFNMLTGYHDEPPHDSEITLDDGQYYNDFFSGNVMGMAPPLSEELIEYPEGVPMTVEQYSRDVIAFLAWASDPQLEERKRMGFRVMIFLLVFAGMMYLVKRKLWADVEH